VSGARFGEAGQRVRAALAPENGGDDATRMATAWQQHGAFWTGVLHDRFAKRLACRAARGRNRRTGGAAPKKERSLYAARARIFPAWAVFYSSRGTDATHGERASCGPAGCLARGATRRAR